MPDLSACAGLNSRPQSRFQNTILSGIVKFRNLNEITCVILMQHVLF